MPAALTTVKAMKEFFKMTTADMRREWSTLSPADKAAYSQLLADAGIPVTDTANYAAKV